MKLFVTGGTGFIGQRFVREAIKKGHKVTVITRSPSKAREILPKESEIIDGNPSRSGIWQELIGDFNAIINLAGESIGDRRWTRVQKERIRWSRINTTMNIVRAIESSLPRKRVFLSASAVGYYGDRGDLEIGEDTDSGKGFLSEVCKEWESCALRAESPNTRVVILRIGVVLGRNGGFLKKAVKPFYFYMGGKFGRGDQWISWIHIDDLVRIMLFCIENDRMKGIYNTVSPIPIKNLDFVRELAKTIKRPCWFKTPSFLLRLLLGERAEMILKGQRVMPLRLIMAGYRYRYPKISDALNDIFHGEG